MSDIHTTYRTTPRTPAHDGPRFSASDRPLLPTESRTTSRTTWRSRAWLWASILVVYGLAALAVVAPATTLAVLLGAVIAGALIWGMSRLGDRAARAWSPESPRASHPASHRGTRRDA